MRRFILFDLDGNERELLVNSLEELLNFVKANEEVNVILNYSDYYKCFTVTLFDGYFD